VATIADLIGHSHLNLEREVRRELFANAGEYLVMDMKIFKKTFFLAGRNFDEMRKNKGRQNEEEC